MASEWKRSASPRTPFQRAKDDLASIIAKPVLGMVWNRHMTLCMAAAGFLAKLAADLRRSALSKPNKASPVTATDD